MAALAAHLKLVLERLQLSRLERPPDARDEPPDQLGRKRVVNRQTYQLLRRSDEPAAIPLHLEVHAFAVRPDHHVRQDSQQCLAARFGPAELLKAAVLFKCETCCGEDLLQQLGLVLERRVVLDRRQRAPLVLDLPRPPPLAVPLQFERIPHRVDVRVGVLEPVREAQGRVVERVP